MTLYLGNNSNLLREAALTATNIVPSSAIFRTDTASKQGRGVVSVTGPYTGAADKTVDVEILDTEGDLARTSQPVFTGVGNGTMTEVTASDDLPAQHVVVALEDLGSLSADATAQFQGQQLDAAEAGSDGNLITITVDRTNVTRTASSYSVPSGGISAGGNEYSGDQWNFGAVTLTADGKFPVDAAGALTAPRISFGDDPQVYRPFRRFVGSGYVYGFSPAPVRDISAGAQVWMVSGAYQLHITNGTPADDETISDVVTLYDALAGVRDDSSLVVVDASVVIANDLTPGGKGVVDVSVWTNAFITEIVRDGSQQILDAQFAINASDDAPSEVLTLTAQTGIRFRVEGSVSGRLSDATAGLPYSDGPYAFVIPEAVTDPDGDPDATIAVDYVPNGEHTDASQMPVVSIKDPRLGPAASAGEYTFVWRNAPPAPCGSEASYVGSIDFACLGLTGGGGAVVATNAQITLRAQKLITALRGYIEDNTDPPQTADVDDVLWLKTVFGLFSDALAKLDSDEATLDDDFPDYEASHDYAKGAIILVSSAGFRFLALNAGNSGASSVTWPTTVGDTVTAGDVEFVNLGAGPLTLFDDAFDDLKTDADGLAGAEAPQRYTTWAPGLAISANSPFPVIPTQPNGYYYTAGAFTARDASGASAGDAGASSTGTVEPIWVTTGTVMDGTPEAAFTWTPHAFTDEQIQGTTPEEFFDRYRSQLNEALFAAGLSANFELAGPKGDGCWRDHPGEPRWESQDGYLPFFSGQYNTTSILSLDANGNPVYTATHEFGFGIAVACPDLLREGDMLRVRIAGGFSEHGGGYQPGDNIQATVIHGEPIAFTGGQTGTDALTWSVMADGLPLAQYVLSLSSPAAYSNGGIGFLITVGSINFVLGDRFEFDIETGRFRYRTDGGSWSDAADIEDTDIGNGLTIAFAGGSAPSWVGGDAWSFLAQAINGPDALRQPTDARCSWTGSTTITVTPSEHSDAKGIAIMDHDIPSDATITLTGGTVGFSVPDVTVSIPWRARNVWVAFTAATCAEWRLAINKGGSANVVYLGAGFTPRLPRGIPEHGTMTKIVQLGSFLKRRALGASIEHVALAEESVEAMLDMLEHACTYDDRRLGFVPNAAQPECGIVSFDPDELSIDDELGFQPIDITKSLQKLTLTLTPVA